MTAPSASLSPRASPEVRHATYALRNLERSLERVSRQMAIIRELVAHPDGRSARRRDGYRLTVKVHGLLNRLRHDAYVRTQAALEVATDLSEGSVEEREVARSLRRRANLVRTALDAYREALSEVLEQQRREEALRVGRDQRLLGYAVAGLAGLAVVPVLIGEMGPGDMAGALGSLPAPFAGLAEALAAARPWIAFSAALGGAALLVALVVTLLRAARPLRETGTEPVSTVGRALMPLRRLAEDMAGGVVDAREADRRACDLLCEFLAVAAATDARAARGSLDEQVDAITLRAELGGRRPVPFPFPAAAALLRHRLDPGGTGEWLGREELAEAIADESLAARLDALAREHAAEDARALSERLLAATEGVQVTRTRGAS